MLIIIIYIFIGNTIDSWWNWTVQEGLERIENGNLSNCWQPKAIVVGIVIDYAIKWNSIPRKSIAHSGTFEHATKELIAICKLFKYFDWNCLEIAIGAIRRGVRKGRPTKEGDLN